MLDSKVMGGKQKSPFMIYANLESPEEFYTNKYKKNVACGYGYKLLCVDVKFIKPCNAYLSEDSVYSFINSMVKETK